MPCAAMPFVVLLYCPLANAVPCPKHISYESSRNHFLPEREAFVSLITEKASCNLVSFMPAQAVPVSVLSLIDCANRFPNRKT